MQSQEYSALSSFEKKKIKYCENCHIICLPQLNIEHCDECNICIENYDHHCFWTGKCIGKNNKFAFLVFVNGTLVYIVLFFGSVLVSFFD